MGQNLKVSSIELDGRDALIVLEYSDLEHTIKWAVWGVKNENAAIALANDSDIGVGGSVLPRTRPRQVSGERRGHRQDVHQ